MRACDVLVKATTMWIHARFARWVLLTIPMLLLCRPSQAQPANAPTEKTVKSEPADPAAAEDARERQSMQRFLSLLEKNPRRGTPLDRVYGYHVERGSLDAFIKSYRDRLEKKPDDGAAWLILGLLEFQRGQDAAAVTALKNAETHRPDDALPSFYLGQALVLIGQPENAAEAFETRPRASPPAPTFSTSSRPSAASINVRRKTTRPCKSGTGSKRVFPGDTRVQEQIAQTLADENEPATASRFEALSKKATDPFRQVQLAISAADLKVRLGKSQDALHDFEVMLGKLRPDSWLHREVRRKIEDVFLRNDDQGGLVKYYEQWSKKQPDDVEALVRLGRTLAGMGRAAEAHAWFDKAVKLVPSRRDLRLALISQLAQDQKFAEAAKEYEALDQAEPNNPDTLKDWGRPRPARHHQTSAREKSRGGSHLAEMLDAKPNDPVTTAQVADLHRQSRADRTGPRALSQGRRARPHQPSVSGIYRRIPP